MIDGLKVDAPGDEVRLGNNESRVGTDGRAGVGDRAGSPGLEMQMWVYCYGLSFAAEGFCWGAMRCI